MMKISCLFGFASDDVDFFDIDLEQDTKLFLEPGIIQTLKDPLSCRAQTIITDYFDTLYNAYRHNASREEKEALLAHFREPNYTKLGYGNGHNGKAKTAQGMLELFEPLDSLYKIGLEIRSPLIMGIFLERFAEDCLSDALTNLLLNELSQYTIDQCTKLGINPQLFQKSKKKLFYWDISTHTWEQCYRQQLTIDGQVILLVPKRWLNPRIYCNAKHFVRSMIIERLRNEGMVVMNNGKAVRPRVKDIKAKLRRKYGSSNAVARHFAQNNPSIVQIYCNNISSYYHKRFPKL